MHVERRAGDRRRARGWRVIIRDNAYRDVWLIVITGLVALALVRMGQTIHDVQEGRRQGVAVTCGATSAVIDAGRSVITGSQSLSPKFEENLRKLGYPPKRVREQEAKAAARAYAAAIAHRIERVAHVRGVVRKDGSLDCRRVQQLSQTGN